MIYIYLIILIFLFIGALYNMYICFTILAIELKLNWITTFINLEFLPIFIFLLFLHISYCIYIYMTVFVSLIYNWLKNYKKSANMVTLILVIFHIIIYILR